MYHRVEKNLALYQESFLYKIYVPGLFPIHHRLDKLVGVRQPSAQSLKNESQCHVSYFLEQKDVCFSDF